MPGRIGALVMLAGALLPASAATPELLSSVPVDRPVDLTSLAWIAPRFSADPAERKRWSQLLDWARGPASQAQTDSIREAFQERGVDAPALPKGCYGDHRCALIVDAEAAAQNFKSWPEFTSAAKEAWPYVLTFRRVTDIVAEIHDPGDDAKPDVEATKELRRRFTNDQILRYAFDGVPGQSGSPADDAVYALYSFALGTDLRRMDDENIQYAQQQISKRGGWPAPPEISEDMHQHLWALVQHGDHRPELQYDALMAMQVRFADQPLPPQYALLYDRVMLKLTGEQRYGTQVTCVDGKRLPLPLDESAPIDTLRADIGLPPLKEYLARFPDCSVVP